MVESGYICELQESIYITVFGDYNYPFGTSRTREILLDCIFSFLDVQTAYGFFLEGISIGV
jgi:hypothetical protein